MPVSRKKTSGSRPSKGSRIERLERERDEAREQARLYEETLRRLEATRSIIRALAEGGGEIDVVRGVLRAICEGLGWRLGEYWAPTEGNDALRLVTDWRADPAEFPGFSAAGRDRPFDFTEGLPGRVWSSGEPLWIDEVTTDDSFVRDVTEKKMRERELERLSRRLLQLQDEERRRIARQLHDTTAQDLAALSMNLSRLSKSSRSTDRENRQLWRDSVMLAEDCVKSIRILSYVLHPPLLDEAGLGPALRWFVTGFSRRSEIDVELQLPDELGRLPRDLEIALFRIVQESLNNVYRHSGSSTALVRLSLENHGAILEIRDRGRGLVGSAGEDDPRQLGVGLAGMDERTRQLGGELTIESGGDGTTIRATFPPPVAEAQKEPA